jgi:predicted negative regulator of RcsB-dependent stress response
MPWKKNDFLAFFIIVAILAVAGIIAYINWEQATQTGITWKFK